MRRRTLVPTVLLFAVACGGSDDHGDPTNGQPHTTGTSTTTPSGPPEGVRVRADSFANGDVVAAVEAHGEAPVELRGRLVVERLAGDDWTSVEGAALELRADCATPAPECVSLVRGGGLRPPRWNARARGGQCDAAAEGAPLPSGRYRFVATTCDGLHRIEGVPFEVTR